jgi:hypothetical protein
MVLGNAEETVTTHEFDEETLEEIAKVRAQAARGRLLFSDCVYTRTDIEAPNGDGVRSWGCGDTRLAAAPDNVVYRSPLLR